MKAGRDQCSPKVQSLTRSLVPLLAVVSALSVMSCASPVVGSPDGAGGDAGPLGGACNATPISAPAVAGTMLTSPPATQPVPAGGTIVDGTYFLTAHETYDAPASGVTYQTVMVIRGSHIELAQIRNAGAEERATLDLTTTGTQFHATTTCPVVGTVLAYSAYTATPTQLVLFDLPRVATLTLQ